MNACVCYKCIYLLVQEPCVEVDFVKNCINVVQIDYTVYIHQAVHKSFLCIVIFICESL